MLANGPVPFDRIASELVPDPACRDALAGWLKVGCVLGELQKTPDDARNLLVMYCTT